MSTIIDKLKDKFGNFVLPVTNTKAVYDDDGNRLDNTLDSFKNLKGYGTHFKGDLNNLTTVGTYLCLDATNVPNYDHWGTCNVFAGGTGSFIQQYVQANTNKMWYRHHNGLNWSEWIEVPMSSLISDAYNPSFTYSVGQYCIYNNILWKSKVDNNLSNYPMEGTYWTATSVGKNLITTNGEGKFGYLGADDSFVPFKSGEGYTLYDDITRIAAVQGAKDLTVLENYPVKKGDLLFVCIVLQSGTYYNLDHTGPQWKFFENYLSNYGGQNTYVIQILEDGNLTMISRASSTAHYVYVRRFINNS